MATTMGSTTTSKSLRLFVCLFPHLLAVRPRLIAR
jgi:hypothetical protein